MPAPLFPFFRKPNGTSQRLRSYGYAVLGGVCALLPQCGSSSNTTSSVAGAGGEAVASGGMLSDAGAAGNDSAGFGASSPGGADTTGESGAAGDNAAAGASGAGASSHQTPNVLFVLTDDLSWNLVPYMPHVLEMQKNGVTFSHYFVTDSLCCPSRSSIFTGNFPHTTGVYSNAAPNGGYQAFLKNGNAKSTFSTALKAAGYQTAMMGKNLNGYLTSMPPDPGWSNWAVADNGYPEFNYDLRINDQVVHYGSDAASYGVDVLSGLGQAFITKAGTAPFLLEIATFAPHAPYTPAPRFANAFPELIGGKSFPKTPSFAVQPGPDAPQWERNLPALTAMDQQDEYSTFRLRAQAVQAVDEMIGKLMAELKSAGLDQSTYVVFSSDNGYHLGEHSMYSGKMTAYDTDIRVPLVVVGPGVPHGVTVDEIAENVDLCPTFIELTAEHATPLRDGHSLVQLIHGQTPTSWRELALIEHKNPTWSATDPDMSLKPLLDPPSYEALALANSTYVEYETGEREYHDHATDPDELTNTFGALPPATQISLHDSLTAVKTCKGSVECWQAQHLAK